MRGSRHWDCNDPGRFLVGAGISIYIYVNPHTVYMQQIFTNIFWYAPPTQKTEASEGLGWGPLLHLSKQWWCLFLSGASQDTSSARRAASLPQRHLLPASQKHGMLRFSSLVVPQLRRYAFFSKKNLIHVGWNLYICVCIHIYIYSMSVYIYFF